MQQPKDVKFEALGQHWGSCHMRRGWHSLKPGEEEGGWCPCCEVPPSCPVCKKELATMVWVWVPDSKGAGSSGDEKGKGKGLEESLKGTHQDEKGKGKGLEQSLKGKGGGKTKSKPTKSKPTSGGKDKGKEG